MVNINFITDPTVLTVIDTILNIAGPNYTPPYDTSAQPSDGAARDSDDYLQYDTPGGATMQGTADPSAAVSMGAAISSLLTSVAPIVSSYMLILPILGVIKGIIEVLCALMNPFAVIRAMARLFSKWIPKFASLFPPLAAVILLLSTIKVILAIVFFIMTVVIPIIQLIIHNIKLLASAFGSDSNEQQRNAGRNKLITLLIDLLNKLGVLSILGPILELLFIILKLGLGKPCKKGKKRPGDDEDSSCCNEETCPPVLKDPPKGTAFLFPALFGEAPPLFAWKLITFTGNRRLPEIVPYMQSLRDQLNPQLDEPVDESLSAGQSGNSAHFNVKIKSRRGQGQEILVPLAKINGTVITLIDPTLLTKMGSVSYEIVPNWEMLVGHNIVGLGCHPDVETAKEFFNERYNAIDATGAQNHPRLAALEAKHAAMVKGLNELVDELNTTVMGVAFDPPLTVKPTKAIPYIATTQPKLPPYDTDIAKITTTQNKIIALLTTYQKELTDTMNETLSKIADEVQTQFEVDKNLVRADNVDKAIVSVIPQDITGQKLSRHLPSGVSLDVAFFTDFGTLSNQTTDSATGTVSMELTSPFPGTASITAKVSSKFISEVIDNVITKKTLKVKFISDGILPQRRFVSKTHSDVDKQSTILTHEREPGAKNV